MRFASRVASLAIGLGGVLACGRIASETAAGPPEQSPIPPPAPEGDAAAGATDAGPSEPPTAPVSTAGTRLRPIHVVTADGLDVAFGVRDTALDLSCTYAGGARCLPDVEAGKLLFADAACTQRVFVGREGLADHAWGVRRSEAVLTLDLGAELPPETQLFEAQPGFCSKVASGGLRIYAASEPSDRFVAATTRTLRRFTEILDAVMVEGSDGSAIFDGELWDRVHAVPVLCPSMPSKNSEAFCLPARIDHVACEVGTNTIFVPNWSFPFVNQGPWLARATPKRTTYTACAVAHAGTWVGDGVLVGEAVDPAAAPRFERWAPMKVAGARTRLCDQVPGVEGVPLVPLGRPSQVAGAPAPLLCDPTLGSAPWCRVDIAADGVSRCLPHDFTEDPWVAYTDPACTSPIVIAKNVLDPKFARAPRGPSGSCSTTITRVAGPLAMPAQVFGRRLGSSCGACSAIDTTGFTAYEALGEEPASSFVEARIELR